MNYITYKPLRHWWGRVSRFCLPDHQVGRLARNSTWVFCANTCSAGLAFFKGIVIARAIGVDQFGIYVQISALVAVIVEITNLNLGTTLVKFGSEFEGRPSDGRFAGLLKLLFLAGICTAAIGGIASSVVVLAIYGNSLNGFGISVWVVAFCFAEAGIFLQGLFQNLLRLEDKFRMSSLLLVMSTVLDVVVVFLCLRFVTDSVLGLWSGLVIARLLSTGLFAIGASRCIRVGFKAVMVSRLDGMRARWNELTRFTVGNSASRTVFTFMNRGDVLILGAFSGNQAVAFYAVAKRLAYTVLLISDPLGNAMYPQLAKLVAVRHFRDARHLLVRISQLAVVPGITLLILGLFASPLLIRATYGVQFAPAASAFCVLLVGAVVSIVCFWNVVLMQCLGFTRLRLLTTAAGFAIAFVLAVILIPSFQAVGVAIALTAANIIIIGTFVTVGLLHLSKQQDIETLT